MATAEQVSPAVDLAAVTGWLAPVSGEDRIVWTAEKLGGGLVQGSRFGAQAAVMLSLETGIVPTIPVIQIDPS